MFALLLTTQQMFAQITEDFSDGNITSNPSWSGDDAKFVLDNGQLRLQAPAIDDKAYLSTPSAAISEARWEFYVRLDFNSSGTNYARVYLTASQPDLADTLMGYFVMIGGSIDEISLYRQTGFTRLKIIDGLDSRISASTVEVRIKVTRDAFGNWQLFSDAGLTGNYILEGSTNDQSHPASAYFGVLCTYTSTRSDKFYFDDFTVTGDPYVPASPPALKDVIITEILADPSPQVDLPDLEFIEVFNRSSTRYNLADWKLTDGSSIASLPSVDLLPNEYLILTATTSAADYLPYGKVVGVNNFPSLNNAGDAVVLKYSNNLTVDSVKYADTWYQDDGKKDGGWTLELIDPQNICGEETNWTSSEDEHGGTPGSQNSVFASHPDLSGPTLRSAIPLSETLLMLEFDEKLSEELPSPQDLRIDPLLEIEEVSFKDRSLRFLLLKLSPPIQRKTRYSLQVQNVRDCSGNLIQPDVANANFALPEKPSSLDVVINEVLFNPRPTGVDFVEIVNRSDKFLNLKNWSLGTFENGYPEGSKIIVESDFLMRPGDYSVLTTDKNVLIGEYPQAKPERLIEVGELPSLNDNDGSVALVDGDGNVIDHFRYLDDYHSPFIKDEEGVSLERISLELPTNDAQNWKSASTVSNFATPGFRNSNAQPDLSTEETIEIYPEIFIPVYGQPDFTEIRYAFDQGGYVANVRIVDPVGRVIKQIANNEVLGTRGFLRWEGDDETGGKARVGYYMVWFEVLNPGGTLQVFRKRLAVATKF